MATSPRTTIQSFLGAKGESLLGFHSPKIAKERLHLPDRPGNNRLDSFQNLIANPRIALLFLVPDRRETLRVNGTGSGSSATPNVTKPKPRTSQPDRLIMAMTGLRNEEGRLAKISKRDAVPATASPSNRPRRCVVVTPWPLSPWLKYTLGESRPICGKRVRVRAKLPLQA